MGGWEGRKLDVSIAMKYTIYISQLIAFIFEIKLMKLVLQYSEYKIPVFLKCTMGSNL